MWKRLSDPTTSTVYKNEPRSTPAIIRLMDEFRNDDCADRVYATTSLGSVSFTLAPDFSLADAFPAVSISPRPPLFTVAYFPARSRQAEASRVCKEDELRHVVELYLLRLLSEASEVR